MAFDQYYQLSGEKLCFNRPQCSAFAKEIAGDFNPIHNIDAKRFCVPGDLLFTVFLQRYGIRQSMHFDFSGMVVDTNTLLLPEKISDTFTLCDTQEKSYLDVKLAGEATTEAEFIHALTLSYVQFSGLTFPTILVDLMQRNSVMINPARPLVIYKSMHIELDNFSPGKLALALVSASMTVDGKKGSACLQFSIDADGKKIGHGEKNMLLSGLREYDQTEVDALVAIYADWKATYSADPVTAQTPTTPQVKEPS